MGSALRIQVVTDSQTVCDMVEQVLGGKGHLLSYDRYPGFCQVYRGEGACRREEACAEVLLLDKHLPDTTRALDWVEQRRKMGCRGNIRNTAVIASEISTQDLQKSKNLGVEIFHEEENPARLALWFEGIEDEYLLDSIDSYFELVEKMKGSCLWKNHG